MSVAKVVDVERDGEAVNARCMRPTSATHAEARNNAETAWAIGQKEDATGGVKGDESEKI